MAAGKVAGREPIYLNPDDAAARGIVDGAVVEVFNDRGRCLAGAVVTQDVPAFAKVAGIPARIIGWRKEHEAGGRNEAAR